LLSEEKERDSDQDIEISNKIILEFYSDESNGTEEIENNNLRSEVLEHFSK
jgi:hypothetical protein